MTTIETNGGSRVADEIFERLREERAGPAARKASVNFIPTVVGIELYAGDGAVIEILVTNPDTGDPVPLTGDVRAQIRRNRPDPTAMVDFAVDLTDHADGIVVVSLTGAQTHFLMETPTGLVVRFLGHWDVEWTDVGAEPLTLVQGDVSCVLDVTRL
jgi:hypothetical protein